MQQLLRWITGLQELVGTTERMVLEDFPKAVLEEFVQWVKDGKDFDLTMTMEGDRSEMFSLVERWVWEGENGEEVVLEPPVSVVVSPSFNSRPLRRLLTFLRSSLLGFPVVAA